MNHSYASVEVVGIHVGAGKVAEAAYVYTGDVAETISNSAAAGRRSQASPRAG